MNEPSVPERPQLRVDHFVRRLVFTLTAWVLFATAASAAFAWLVWTPSSGRLRISRSEAFVVMSCLGLSMTGVVCLLAVLSARFRRAIGSDEIRLGNDPRFARVTGALLLIPVFGFAYAGLVEPRWIAVRDATFAVEGLERPVSLVLLADTHCEESFPVGERVAGIVADLDPDMVLFAGDALNRKEAAETFRRFLSSVAAGEHCFAVAGNWDVWYWSRLGIFEETGFEELSGEWRTVDVGGQTIHIGGHRYTGDYDTDVVGEPPEGDGVRVFLYHSHDFVEQAAARGVDVYLCGDTHGGQIALPWYGALVSIGRHGRTWQRGAYRVGEMHLYVSPGIGMERGFGFRFGVRPEVTRIRLVPASSASAER